jgi:hypothetical protein
MHVRLKAAPGGSRILGEQHPRKNLLTIVFFWGSFAACESIRVQTGCIKSGVSRFQTVHK